jgi:hypothetical protein
MADLLVISDSIKKHLRHVRTVLACLNTQCAFPKKCELYRTSVEYLGHIVEPEKKGIAAMPSMHELSTRGLILPIHLPDVKSLRQVLKLADFCRYFIVNCAAIAPTDLLGSKVTWHWSPRHRSAFATLSVRYHLNVVLCTLALPDNRSLQANMVRIHGSQRRPCTHMASPTQELIGVLRYAGW